MNGPREGHTERSKSEREGEISYDVPYMWNLKRKDTNGLTYKTGRLTDLEYELMVAGRRGYLGSSGGHVHTAIFKMDNQ